MFSRFLFSAHWTCFLLNCGMIAKKASLHWRVVINCFNNIYFFRIVIISTFCSSCNKLFSIHPKLMFFPCLFAVPGNDTNMTEYYDEEYLWNFYEDYFGVSFPEKDVADKIYLYVSPILLLLGTIGNVFSVIVLQKLSRKVMSTCLYLAVLAVVDLIVLYTRCGNDWLTHLAKVDLSNRLMVYSESICKVYPFVFNFIVHLSRWLIVAMTIEAFIAIKYPPKMANMCTQERARAVILLLTVLLVCVNLHFFWSYELVPLNELSLPPGLFCTFAKHGHQHSEEFQEIIWPIMDLLVAEILPYATVITCCIIMAIQIGRGRHRGDKHHQAWQRKFMLDSNAIEQLKLTYLVVCLVFFFLTLPKFGYVMYKYMVEKYNLVEYSFQNEARQLLVHALCASLEYTFLSGKIIVYLACSRKFRTEFLNLFRRCRKRRAVIHTPRSNAMMTRPLMQNGRAETMNSPRVQLSSSNLLREPSIITTVWDREGLGPSTYEDYLSRNRDSQYKDEMVSWPYLLYDRNSFDGKMASSHWNGPHHH